jgi:hypothetical protein
MPWVLAILVVLMLFALITFCIINAVRIVRDMNETVATFRSRLEDDANAVLKGLFDATRPDDPAGPSVSGSHPTASD